ncbi:MAG: ribbon-helix-helix protein, CopG family [Parasphingopyxis sp.]
MAKTYRVLSIRIDADAVRNLTVLAATLDCSRSEAVRKLIDFGLPYVQEGIAPNYARQALTSEYVQIVADMIVAERFSDRHDAIIEEAHKRVRNFHHTALFDAQSGNGGVNGEGADG